MRRITSLLLLILTLVSCKSKAPIVSAPIPPKEIVDSSLTKIIENHYKRNPTYSTLYINADVRFSDNKQTQNVTAEIKMQKDKQILISLRFLGITMAKALITPQSLHYYEKINNHFFEGDFNGLSRWLGEGLDFYKIQNLLLGEAFDDLRKGKYVKSTYEQGFILDDYKPTNDRKVFYLDANTLSIQKQEITQAAQNRTTKVTYSEINSFNQAMIPMNLQIQMEQSDALTEIELHYNTIRFDENLTFPYNVPKGYKRIIIK